MKKRRIKLIALVFLLSIFIFTSTNSIHSQDELSFEEAYTNYTTQLEEYQRSHNRYVLARSQYLRFQTLAAQEEAYNATLDMLQQRNEVVTVYLESLRARLQRTEGVDEAVEDRLTLRINDEISWFNDHTARLPSTGTLDDLVEDSNEARDRYQISQQLIYEVFSEISFGRVTDYHDRTVDIYSDMRAKFEDIRSEEREEYVLDEEKLLTIDRWLVESENRISRSEEKLLEAREIIIQPPMRGRREQPYDDSRYNQVVGVLEESRLHLKEATSFIREVVREIKQEG